MKEIVIANLGLDFALRIVNLYKYLCNNKNEHVMSKQLLRCGTSIGANIAESEHAQSTADFLSKLSISLKEANETKYWITLLHKADYLTEKECESMMTDLRIIIGTLVNTIKKTKDNPTEL
ncbi:MAG: four helix bundle protein [Bacteroidaceae bacterium]|nr:four helix bundle protein [Bacteroidaceae bacterium]